MRELSKECEDPDVWKDRSRFQDLNREKARLEKTLENWRELDRELKDQETLLELIEEEREEKALSDLRKDLESLSIRIEKRETESFLGGENDLNNAYMSIHSGAGGTEASDWTALLYRMYSRWVETRNYKPELLSLTEGEEAGIKSVSVLIKGEFAYGYLKGESGVHRLVRISPFDANSRRHTSFASVFVWPEMDDRVDIQIQTESLRIDTYRAGGAGGQHVNRTDSAVRITHKPTGIVVQCQNQRSQHANKDKAMKMLKSAIYKREMEKRAEEKAEREASKKANEWGSQIRSYILHPYQMVKDHRTRQERSNPKAVLDGDIDSFISANLRQRIS